MPNKTRARGNWRRWIDSGRPSDEEIRGWRRAHVVRIIEQLDSARARMRRLRDLLDSSKRGPGRLGLHPEAEAPMRDYERVAARCEKLAREADLLYLLLEARSLGTIRNGRLVLGSIVGKPTRVRLGELEEVRASRRRIEEEMKRARPARRRPASPPVPSGNEGP